MAIADATDLKTIPLPLIIFLSSLLKPKAFMPDDFLTPFELNRVSLDDYGAITKLS